jgi:Flp pilus assembly protein TadG
MLKSSQFTCAARLLRRFRRDSRGIAAVEFALVLPLMVTLYLGGIEVSEGISIDRKVSLTTRAVADLVSQGTTITNADMANIMNAAKAVAAPYPSGKLKVIVSSIKIDGNKKATVEWSDALNTAARAKGDTVTLPDGLLLPNTWIIWGEASYMYQPTIGYTITGAINLKDQIYMRPRNQDFVSRAAT